MYFVEIIACNSEFRTPPCLKSLTYKQCYVLNILAFFCPVLRCSLVAAVTRKRKKLPRYKIITVTLASSCHSHLISSCICRVVITDCMKSWLRHYATNLKAAGSSPDEVDFFFNRPNPSSRTMALGSTQPLTEMSTMNLPGCKGRPARKADNFTRHL
jgi:hypothetical protein